MFSVMVTFQGGSEKAQDLVYDGSRWGAALASLKEPERPFLSVDVYNQMLICISVSGRISLCKYL
jgi:hypothetical protein